MIETSYYPKLKQLQELNKKLIGISNSVPGWFVGETRKDLAPSWSLVRNHKNKAITDTHFVREYYNYLERTFDREKLLTELDGSVLLCYCSEGKFCHRHILAHWLYPDKQIDIEIYF